MEYKKTIEHIQMQARSESMTKWIGRIEDETDIITSGDTPTQRMEDLIAKIKTAITSNEVTYNTEIDEDINELIVSAYSQGVQDGFAKSLSKFIKGSITTKKVRNEDSWVLSTNSTSYQITASLPTIDDGEQKITVKIKLSEHGFK